MVDGRVQLVIPAVGEYRRWAEVTAASAVRGSSLPVDVTYLDWTNVDRARLERFGLWHGSAIAWSRLFLTEILPSDVDWVISCDADVLFRGDLAKLWALRDARKVVLMSGDSQPPGRTHHPDVARWLAQHPEVDPGEVLCSGLTLINLRRWREEGWQARIEDFIRRYPDVPFLDQMALNVVFRDEKAKPPRAWGCFSGDANNGVDYDGDCAIHYVGDTPWKRRGLTRLTSEAVVLWRRATGMPCGGWRRGLWLMLRATRRLWRWNAWMAWHFRTALREPDRRVPELSVAGRRILHVVPGLDERANGIAVAARLIADGQRADGAEVELVETRQFADEPGDLSRWDEVWVHSMWLPETVRACRLVLKAGRPLVRMTHANLDPLRLRFRAWKKLPVWWLFERRLFSTCNRVVVTCEAEVDWCRAKGVSSPIQTVDLKRYFDLAGMASSPCADETGGSCARARTPCLRRSAGPTDTFHLLYLGRLHPLKGVDALQAAVAALGDSRVELRIVSDHFGDELERDWAWADLLVLPTLSENFGLVVAEALSRGKPVLTTDGAPAWENQPGVIYVKGYRDASFAVRVRLLQDALLQCVATAHPSQTGKES